MSDDSGLRLEEASDVEENQQQDPLPSVEEYKADTAATKNRPDPDGRRDIATIEKEGSSSTIDTGACDDSVCLSTAGEEEGAVGLNKKPALTTTSRKLCNKRILCWYTLLFLVILLAITIPVAWTIRNKNATRKQDVIDFLVENEISTSFDLKNMESPQYHAAKWIANNDGMTLGIPQYGEHIAFVERYVMAVLFYALDGHNWKHDLNFLSPNHICTWYANITVGNEEYIASAVGAVGVHGCKKIDKCDIAPFSLYLPDMGLKGSIPPEIQHLDRMEVLSLQFNPDLHGTIPVELSFMSDLKHLALQYNGFKGTIPEWIGELTALKYLGLGNNMFTGPIPTSIVLLTNLEVLGLDDNGLSANIELFAPLSKLKSLYVEDNGISGTLSNKLLESWPEMVELDLSNNFLHGKLPPALFINEQSQLRVLDLHGNKIMGPISDRFWEPNYNLEFLALHDNRLSSTVPASLTNLKNLRHLDISRNMLTSTLPDELGEMTQLEYLFTATNAFNQGRLPSFIEKLTNLRELGMKDNKLTGQLPEFIRYLTNLQFLDLHANALTGRIPETIGSLSNIEHLVLKGNQLTGSLPSGMDHLNKLNFILLDDNSFVGNADIICNNDKLHQELAYFVSDCGGEQPEIECSCCQKCCEDGDRLCNTYEWEGNLDPVWEFGYERGRYAYDLGPEIVVVSSP